MYRTDEVNLPQRTSKAVQLVNGCYEDQTTQKVDIRLIQLLEMKRALKLKLCKNIEDSRTPFKKSICGTDLESRSIESLNSCHVQLFSNQLE